MTHNVVHVHVYVSMVCVGLCVDTVHVSVLYVVVDCVSFVHVFLLLMAISMSYFDLMSTLITNSFTLRASPLSFQSIKYLISLTHVL